MTAGVKVEMCKCDWTKCRKDCECRCHIAIEAESNHSWKVGISSGLDQAAGILLKQSADAFVAGRDEEAKLLRNLNKTLIEAAKKAHPGPEVLSYEE